MSKLKGNPRMTEREVNAVYDSLLRSINQEVEKVKRIIMCNKALSH